MNLQKYEVTKINYLLKKGEILVLPTDTVYGLALSLKKSERTELIYQIKQRNENKPLAIVVSDLKMAKSLGKFDNNAFSLLQKYPAGKITLIVPKNPHLTYPYLEKLEKVGIRVTADEWLKKIINSVGPLLMTSWNISGCSPFTSPQEGKTNSLICEIVDGGILDNKPSLVFDNVIKKWIRFNYLK